jgi:hypothetical protein
LGFTIDTSYLDQFAANPSAIQVIQFNILTMNVPALTPGEVSERVLDAIGDQSELASASFSNPITVNLADESYISDQTSSVPEQAHDTFPTNSNLPPVDLIGWSLQIAQP